MRTLAGSIPSSGLVTVAGPGAFPCVKSSPLLLMRSHAQQAAVAFGLRANWNRVLGRGTGAGELSRLSVGWLETEDAGGTGHLLTGKRKEH